MSKPIPSFDSELERQKWFVANADYFTIIRFRNRKYERVEVPNLAGADLMATRMVFEEPGRPLMIYAVVGSSDHFVKTVGG